MILEKDYLDQRRFELNDYYASPAFAALSPQKQELILAQLEAMRAYSEILSIRIAIE